MIYLLYFKLFAMEDFIYPANIESIARASDGFYEIRYIKTYARN